MNQDKINVAVIAGGDSGEYTISLKSASIIMKYLEGEKYAPFLVHIKFGEWYCLLPDSTKVEIDKNDFSITVDKEKIRFDVVFTAIHGTPGEDGKLQGYFDLLGIPYTSCGSITSALTFNKAFCNKVVASTGVTVSPSVHLIKGYEFSIDDILATTGLPCFVKPNCGGSSVGMSKVKVKEHLLEAIETAFKEDNEVLVEKYVKGREITCGVFKSGEQIIALPIVEVVSKKEFFDYEAKYNELLAEELIPAPIDSATEIKCKETSILLYKALNCKGVVRFDYIFNESVLNFLEVNTVPGMSSASIVPKMAQYQGYTLNSFYDILITEAMKQKMK